MRGALGMGRVEWRVGRSRGGAKRYMVGGCGDEGGRGVGGTEGGDGNDRGGG